MEAHFCLWKATGDRAHLAGAHDLLHELREHAPHQDRDSMLDRVPLHRSIREAQAGERAVLGGDQSRSLLKL
jgi:hypothetical protein